MDDSRPLSIFGPVVATFAVLPDDEFATGVALLFDIAARMRLAKHIIGRLVLVGCLLAPIRDGCITHALLAYLRAVVGRLDALSIDAPLMRLALCGDACYLAVRDVVLPRLGDAMLEDLEAAFTMEIIRGGTPPTMVPEATCRAMVLGGDLVHGRMRTAIVEMEKEVPDRELEVIRVFALSSGEVEPWVALQFVEAIEEVYPMFETEMVTDLSSVTFVKTQEDIETILDNRV
jgi:hypothetical protein